MTTPSTNGLSPARLRALYHRLVALGERNGVPHEDAQELTNDTLRTLLDQFDPERGRAETFTEVVMMNKIRNFIRDHKRPPTVPFDDDLSADPETPESAVTRMEDIMMLRKARARLLAALTEEEARFLLEFEVVLDELDDRAVSETARRLDLTPQQGHNIRQRIERKARKIAALVGGAPGTPIRAIVRSDLEIVASEALPESAFLDKLLRFPSRALPGEFDMTLDICRAGIGLSDEGLGRFLGTLDAGRRDRLISLLS